MKHFWNKLFNRTPAPSRNIDVSLLFPANKDNNTTESASSNKRVSRKRSKSSYVENTPHAYIRFR